MSVCALVIEVNISSCSLALMFLFNLLVKNKNTLKVLLPTDVSGQDNFNKFE